MCSELKALAERWRDRQVIVERVGMIVSLAECADELSALIPAVERYIHSLELSQKLKAEEAALRTQERDDMLHQMQAAVEAEREACADTARRTPFRSHAENDFDFHSGCIQTRESIYAAIRGRGSRDALDEMLAEAEKRGYKRGLKENLSRSQEKRLASQLERREEK